MQKLLTIIIVVFALGAAVSCRNGHSGSSDRFVMGEEAVALSSLDITRDTIGTWADGSRIAPARGESLGLRRLGQPYHKIFNDSNYVHYEDAVKIGIDPIKTTADHWNLRRPLVKIVSCADFFVDTLKYSKPYLVPEAAALLHEIGSRFRDSLDAHGGGDYRVKVTSVLRTADNVKRLRRRNRNAVDSSVHQFGTTVDISYVRFVRDSETCPDRGTDDLKALLAQILFDLRNEGRCWVKYEIHQPCFHITARPYKP